MYNVVYDDIDDVCKRVVMESKLESFYLTKGSCTLDWIMKIKIGRSEVASHIIQ